MPLLFPEGSQPSVCTWLDNNLCELLILAQSKSAVRRARKHRTVANQINKSKDEIKAMEEVCFSHSLFVILTDDFSLSK
jgi:hypothetical protein